MPELGVRGVGELSREGAERLRHAGIAEPRRQAQRVWRDLELGEPAALVLEPESPVHAGVARRFEQAIARLCRGEPLAYITGLAGFRHLSLMSDERALVPRPETEGLVELLLQRVRRGRVVDVGTGSGCIALSLAQEGEFTEIVGVDCSTSALALAAVNRKKAELPVTLVLGDLCRPLRPGAFDALISNPPYLTLREYSSLHASVRDWEPAVALVSGQDGMAATGRLLDEGREVLRPGGWLALEVDCARAGVLAERAEALGWSDVSLHTDLFGRERYLLARRSDTR